MIAFVRLRRERVLPGAVLATVCLATSAVLFWHLDWGLPRAAWLRILQRYEAQSVGYAGRMLVEVRSRNEDAWKQSGALSMLGLRQALDSEPRNSVPLDGLDEFAVLRRYALASRGADEYGLLAVVQRMARERTLDPRSYKYGGAHLYPMAAGIGVGVLLGDVPKSLTPEMVVHDPTSLRPLYIYGRAVGALALIAALTVLAFLLWRRNGSLLDAVLLVSLVGMAPLTIVFARSLKPPATCTAYATLAVVALVLHEQKKRAAWLVVASVLAGLTISSQITTAAVILLPLIYVLADHESTIGTRVRGCMTVVLIPAGLAYFVTNPFIFMNPAGFLEAIRVVDSTESYGYGLRGFAPTLVSSGDALIRGMGPAMAILFILGLGSRVRRGRLGIASRAAGLVGLLVAGSYFGAAAPRFAMYLLPVCAFAGLEGKSTLVTRIERRVPRALAAVALVGLVSVSVYTAGTSLRALGLEADGYLEKQVERFLETHDLEGSTLAFEKAFPVAQVPLPLFGLEWFPIGSRAAWDEGFRPDLVALREPLESKGEWDPTQYELVEVFAIPRSGLHKIFAYGGDWFAETHLYRKRMRGVGVRLP